MMADLLKIEDMEIGILTLGICMTNCYIIGRRNTKDVLIIDPADGEDAIRGYLEDNGMIVSGILLTHGHFDHIFAAEGLRGSYHTELYVHREEEALLLDPAQNCTADFMRAASIRADRYLEHGEQLEIAGLRIRVIHTPGHTQGSACYLFPDYNLIFSGDTLFLESVGRTDMPTGNGERILSSVKNRLFVLEDKVLVLPGHGERTTIGHERKNNPYIAGL